VTQHRMVNSDATGVTPEASGVHQTKTQRALKLSSHWTLNSDASDVTSDASGVAPDANLETLCDCVLTELFTPNSKRLLFLSPVPHRKPPKVDFAAELHHIFFNSDPCFQVPTQECNNTCACVLAFHKQFYQRFKLALC